MVFTNKISKEKLWGGTAGVFSNWLTFGVKSFFLFSRTRTWPSMGARTNPEAYFFENMVAVPPHNFCTQISIRKPYGIY